MKVDENAKQEAGVFAQNRNRDFLFDFVLYLSIMFLVREVYFSSVGFMVNGLIWSLTTLVFANWRMKVRKITWEELGLCKPQNYKTAMIATVFVLGFAILSIIIFEILKDQLFLELAPDTSNESAVHKFGNLKGNWVLFLSIIPIIWLESFLEEILDRGFLINWIEKMLSSTIVATVAAVVLQAVIFGFRHSYDLSERSITVGLIGLAMGIGYVLFGRNLWPLIVAHCALNTISMFDRVT
jgi:hypothetical protein